MSKELTDIRTAQTVRARKMKFWDRIGIGIWTCTKNGFCCSCCRSCCRCCWRLYLPTDFNGIIVCCILVKVGKKSILKFSKKCWHFPKNALEKVGEMIMQFDSATKTTNFEPRDFEIFPRHTWKKGPENFLISEICPNLKYELPYR